MNSDRIIEEIALLDGYTFTTRWPNGSPYWDPHSIDTPFNMSGNEVVHPPNYIQSHDAIQRVIDKMNESQHGAYRLAIAKITASETNTFAHQATPEQKCKALLEVWEKYDN